MSIHASETPAAYSAERDGRWHTLALPAVGQRAGVQVDHGLSEAEVHTRLARYGPNRVPEEPPSPLWKLFVAHLREPMLLLLLGVGVVYLLFGQPVDAVVVWAIVFSIVNIELVNERRAEHAIAALHALAEPHVPLRRDGQVMVVPAAAVVPGDVLVLEAGRRLVADARLVESHSLLLDESPLTGESSGVEKEADTVLPADTALAERYNLVFAGTTILRGRGTAVVIATGPHSELGQLIALTRQAEELPTPLQQTLRQLAGWMVWIAAGFSVGIPLVGWLTGQPLQTMFLTALALFFASVPEELPVIITLMLAFGGYWLSRRNALVRRQRAVEVLGAVSVIATDKTGTLTENRMVARMFWPEQHLTPILRIGAICNDVATESTDTLGDPLDRALVVAAQAHGLDVAALRAAYPLRDEYSFDNARKRMSVVTRHTHHFWVAVKGAPEAVLERSIRLLTEGGVQPLTRDQRTAIAATVAQMAAAGLRVVALAEQEHDTAPRSQEEAESALTFVGLVGLEDPLRPETRDAIASCHAAGIRTVIVSGDHPLTTGVVAAQLGFPPDAGLLSGTDVDALDETALRTMVQQVPLFARTTPEQKLRIVTALQRNGEVVAATGDGINDAPALAAANIGVAMGQTGTDVARAAADLVLTEDSFATLVQAIQQSRGLFANLEKAIQYYLACKVALVTSLLVPVLLQLPVPFLPVQIILMELIMDVAASAGFLAEPLEPDVMRRPPRNTHEPVLNRRTVLRLLSAALGLAAAVVVAYLVTWYGTHDNARAQTAAFVTWLLGHVLMAFTLRSAREPLFRIGLRSNRVLAGWGLAVVGVLVLIATVPAVQLLTRTIGLSGRDWVLVIGTAGVGTLWREVAKWVARAGRPAA